MAADDIYRLEIHYEGPSQAASSGLYYFEDSPRTSVTRDCESLASSWTSHLLDHFRNVCSLQWRITAIEVNKVWGDADPMALLSPGNGTGIRPGASLPGNNCILLQLIQNTFPRTSNGRMYLPGLSEIDTETGRLEQAFVGDELQSLVSQLIVDVPENGGTGVWQPVVISAKIRDQNAPPKNWPGAVANMAGVSSHPLIARQRRRTTPVRGRGVL